MSTKPRVSASEAHDRSLTNSAAWRASGSPRDPQKVWLKALKNLVIPETERFNVYVFPDLLGEGLTGDEASDFMSKVRRFSEYQERSVNDFEIWPVSAEPIPVDPTERMAANLCWFRSLGLAAPHPDEDTPERRAWEAWKVQGPDCWDGLIATGDMLWECPLYVRMY